MDFCGASDDGMQCLADIKHSENPFFSERVVIPAKAEALYNSEAGQSVANAKHGFRPSPE
ncbi:hypothetical protein [Dyella nitratireducens]|nr:hypothetical protein [Dyella nitratireducens]